MKYSLKIDLVVVLILLSVGFAAYIFELWLYYKKIYY